MKAKVTEDCIACELCVETCPQVFEMGDGMADREALDEVAPPGKVVAEYYEADFGPDVYRP